MTKKPDQKPAQTPLPHSLWVVTRQGLENLPVAQATLALEGGARRATDRDLRIAGIETSED